MYVTPEQIQAAQKAGVESLLAVANAQFAAFEKLANITAGAVKGAFEDSIANSRALRLGRRRRRREVDARRRQFGVRQHEQGRQAGERDRRSQRCRRDRDGQGIRESKKGRLSAKKGLKSKSKPRSSAKRKKKK